MKNVLFYNSNTGAGAVGEIIGDDFKTIKSFNPEAFSINWSHLESTNRGIIFYKQVNGEAARGFLSKGDFLTTDTFPPGIVAPGWTQIHNGPDDHLLFYRASSGEGAIVISAPSTPAFRTVKSFPTDSFSRNWTHIVEPPNSSLVLFYKIATGEGAIAEWFDNRPPSPVPTFGNRNDIRTLQVFTAGSFATNWSHVVALGSGEILFYNQQTGAGAIVTFTRGGFTTVSTFPAGAFLPGWTHIVSAGDSTLFYNATNGAGAIGFNPTLRSFPAGSFSVGWTHVVTHVDPPPIH